MKTPRNDDPPPPSSLVPVTTMEEIVTLTIEERTLLLQSLNAAEAEFAKGKGAAYDRDEMRRHFFHAYDAQRAVNTKEK